MSPVAQGMDREGITPPRIPRDNIVANRARVGTKEWLALRRNQCQRSVCRNRQWDAGFDRGARRDTEAPDWPRRRSAIGRAAHEWYCDPV